VSRTIGRGPWCGTNRRVRQPPLPLRGVPSSAYGGGAASATSGRRGRRPAHPEGKPESYTTYVNYGCRCDGCSGASRDLPRAYRARKAASKIADGASPCAPSATPAPEDAAHGVDGAGRGRSSAPPTSLGRADRGAGDVPHVPGTATPNGDAAHELVTVEQPPSISFAVFWLALAAVIITSRRRR
jgi:hypothetical protein